MCPTLMTQENVIFKSMVSFLKNLTRDTSYVNFAVCYSNIHLEMSERPASSL